MQLSPLNPGTSPHFAWFWIMIRHVQRNLKSTNYVCMTWTATKETTPAVSWEHQRIDQRGSGTPQTQFPEEKRFLSNQQLALDLCPDPPIAPSNQLVSTTDSSARTSAQTLLLPLATNWRTFIPHISKDSLGASFIPRPKQSHSQTKAVSFPDQSSFIPRPKYGNETSPTIQQLLFSIHTCSFHVLDFKL